MRVMLLLVAIVALLAGCGPKNPVAPPPTAPALNGGKADPSRAPYYEPTYIGEPCRGNCPDLGPTG